MLDPWDPSYWCIKCIMLGTISSDFLFRTCYAHNSRSLASQQAPFHPGNSPSRAHKYDCGPAVLRLARLMAS